jgi:hypothetical protein
MTAVGPDAPHPKIARLISHWRALAPAPDRLPGRQHFDPMQVPDLLPHLWLVDVLDGTPRGYRYRLVGGAIAAVGPPIHRGMVLDRPSEVARLYDAVVEGKQVDWRRGAPLLDHARHVDSLERAVMPLAADGVTVDMLLGITLFYWKDGRVY